MQGMSGKRGYARRDVHPLPLEVGQLPFDEVVVAGTLLLLRVDGAHFLGGGSASSHIS